MSNKGCSDKLMSYANCCRDKGRSVLLLYPDSYLTRSLHVEARATITK
jgi:hypothetical protein